MTVIDYVVIAFMAFAVAVMIGMLFEFRRMNKEEMKALQAKNHPVSSSEISSEYTLNSLDELFRDNWYCNFRTSLLHMPTLQDENSRYSKETARNYAKSVERIGATVRGSGEKITIERLIENVNHGTEMVALFLFLFWAKKNYLTDEGYDVFMREVADKQSHKYYRLYEAKYMGGIND